VPGSLVGVIATFDERLEMAFPVSLTRRDGGRGEHLFLPRLLAFVQAPRLDTDLCAGVRPSASRAHRLRADHLRRRRVRRVIATALRRAVEDAHQPVRPRTAQAPLNREGIRRCQREILALADLVSTLESPRAQGIAIAFQLAFDGCGPLFFQPGTSDGTERLANTVEAAHRALRVSADFE
jgi:hypothetical protein